MLVLVMAVCVFAACDSKKDGKTDETAATVNENAEAEEAINEYLDGQREEIDASIEAYKSQGIDLDVYADGDALVYECVIGATFADDQLSYVKESLTAELDAFPADAIFDECEAIQSIKIVYYDANNTKLCEKTFSR